jgi:hypothetical protein
MHIFGDDFLAGAAFPGDENGGFRAGHLLGHLDDALHGRVAIEEIRGLARHCGDDGRNELGIGRQGDIFLGAGADGVDGGSGIGLDAAGHDRNGDALGFEPGDQPGNVHHHVDQQQVGALAAAQRRQGNLDGRRVGHLGAAVHGHLGSGGELALKGPDDEQAHDRLPLIAA